MENNADALKILKLCLENRDILAPVAPAPEKSRFQQLLLSLNVSLS